MWSIHAATAAMSLDLKANVCSVRYNPWDSNVLAVGSAAHSVLLYDLRAPRHALLTLMGHRKAVSYVRWVLVWRADWCIIRAGMVYGKAGGWLPSVCRRLPQVCHAGSRWRVAKYMQGLHIGRWRGSGQLCFHMLLDVAGAPARTRWSAHQ